MGKIRKAIASISMVAVLSTLVMSTTAFAFSFTDVKASDWFFGHVTTLVDAGAVDGTKTTFKPGDNIVRAEVTKIIVEFNDLTGDTLGSSMFSDSKVGTWYDPYVGIAAQYGILSGDAGKTTVRPGADVNRAEVAKMLVEANGLASCGVMGSDVFPDVAVGTWYDEYMGTAYCYGVLGGYADGTAGPSRPANRAEFAKMAVKASEGVLIDMGDDDVADDDGGPTGGDVTVSDDNSPDTMEIPSYATSVGVLNFEVTAGAGGTTIESITIKKSGVSALGSGFQGYLYEGTDRLTSGKSINSESDEIFFTNLGWEVEAGDSRTFTFKVDMGSNAAGTVEFSITDIDAGVSEVTGLPVESAVHGLSATPVGTITVEKDSSITNPKVGEQDVIVARFKANAATEDAMLEQFGVYFTGNIDTTAIQNLELYVAGEVDPIATVAGVNAKEVANFIFDTPFTIIKGDTKSFTVKADLNTGRSADTLKAYVDESTDVVAIGAKYGFGMKVTRTAFDGDSCTTTSGDCSYSVLEGGDITISSNGPSATDVATNAKDVVLMNFNIASVSPVVFKNFEVALTASESADTDEGLLNDSDSDSANLTDIKIINVDTGKTLMGPVDATSFVTLTNGTTAISEAAGDGAQAFYKFTDEFDMDAGEGLNLALTADIKNAVALENMTVIPALSITSTLPEVRDVNNKVITNSSSIVPSSTITGKTMTVKTPTLTVGLSSDPTDKTYVKGSKDVKFACFSMQASQSSDIKITSMTIGSSFSADADAGYVIDGEDTVYLNAIVGSIKLVDGAGVEKAASKSVPSAGITTFDNMNYTVAAGATQLLCVQGNISADAYKDSNGEQVAFGISAPASITAEDKNGNSLATAQKVVPNVNGALAGTPTTEVTVSAGGSLTIAVDPSTAKEDIRVAGTTGVAVSKFKFTTTAEGFTVKKLSINNRQSAATTAALGDYDNNVTKVTLSYKDKAGTTKTADGFLTQGTANFSGLDFYIGKDTDEVLTVSADLSSISDGSAAAGEFVDLNIAFNDFEAVAEGSGETYKGSKIDQDVAAASDLDFGTITWTDPAALDVNVAVAALASPGSAQTLIVDNAGAATPINLPVGTLLCVTTAATCDTAASAVLVVTSWTEGTAWVDGTSGDTVATVVLSDNDTQGDADAFANNDDIIYSLPGTGYLTGANRLHVYESKPAIALSASSPSGGRNVNASDQPFIFSLTETGGKEKLQFRQAQVNAATANTTDWTSASALDGTWTATDARSTVASGGISDSAFQRETSGGVNAAGLIYTFGTAADLSGYNGISFWSKASTTANTLTLTLDDDAGSDQTVATTTGTAETWEFTDLSFVGTASTDLDVIATLTWAVTDGSAENAATYDVDEVTLYKERIVVNGTSDTDFDTNTTGGADNLIAYLKDGSTTEFQGYFYSSTQGANSSTIAAHMYPTGDDFEVSKGTAKTLALQTSTSSLLDEDAGVDDPVTFNITLGSSADGTITAGGLYWYDTNALVRWLGDVANTTFNSNTMNY